MPRRPPLHRPHQQPRPDERPNSAQRGYDAVWRRLRALHLARHPYCAECWRYGQSEPATVVDHVVPHKGDDLLRLNAANLRSLCKHHHDVKTATQDGGLGRVRS